MRRVRPHPTPSDANRPNALLVFVNLGRSRDGTFSRSIAINAFLALVLQIGILPMDRSMKGFARNAARISILAIYSGATALLSAYGAKAGFITLSDFDNTAVVTDLNDLGVPTPNIFATPLKVGIYLFTTDSGQLGYGASGLNNSNALSTTTDLGWMRIDIAPSAQVTKFGLLVGLPGSQQHNHEAVLFFDNYNHLLGGTGVSRGGGFQFVAFENTEGLIGSVLIQDADLNSSSFAVDNLVSQSHRP
jgi:hypothetical protein